MNLREWCAEKFKEGGDEPVYSERDFQFCITQGHMIRLILALEEVRERGEKAIRADIHEYAKRRKEYYEALTRCEEVIREVCDE